MGVIDTTNKEYIAHREVFMPNGKGAYNGVYYYSLEIVKNIIPNVKTERPWDTLGMKFIGSFDHAIVFLHHNIEHDRVYGCSVNQTYEWAKAQPNGHAILLPMSIDKDYVEKFRVMKEKDACYAGNIWDFELKDIEKYVPKGVDFPPKDLPREELLKFMAPYRVCYAVGRTALEASALGCEVRNCDSRFDGVEWLLLDNKQAAIILQIRLDEIDGK